MYTLLAQTNLNFYNEAANQDLPGVTGNLANVADRGFGGLIGNVLGGIIVIAALLVLVYLLWGGIEWITSGGDKGKLESARNKITSAVIGIIVLSASTAIFMLVQNFLGISVLNFGGSRSSSSSSGTSGCTVGQRLNDGGAGGYCTSGAAIVECHAANNNLPYNHFDPCSCVEGSDKQVSGYDFSTCN